MKGYKGFDKDLKGMNLQYKVGETFQESEAKLWRKGLHFCLDPLEVFEYYAPNKSRFCEIEASDVSDEAGGTFTRVAKKLYIKKEIGLLDIIQAAEKYIFDEIKFENENNVKGDYCGASGNYCESGAYASGYNSGAIVQYEESAAYVYGSHSVAYAVDEYSSAQVNGSCSVAIADDDYSSAQVRGYYSGAYASGDNSGASVIGGSSAAVASGDNSGASVIGDYSAASATGKNSAALAVGKNSAASAGKGSLAIASGVLSRAKGDLGAFIILTEYGENDKITEFGRTYKECFIKDVKCAKVDGEKIKADTWYILKDGNFVEVDEED